MSLRQARRCHRKIGVRHWHDTAMRWRAEHVCSARVFQTSPARLWRVHRLPRCRGSAPCNVAFLLKLIDSGVEVLFADLPELNGAMGRFMLTTMASVAELEAGLISERTKAALKAAKARGVTLGRHGAEFLLPSIGMRLIRGRSSSSPLFVSCRARATPCGASRPSSTSRT